MTYPTRTKLLAILLLGGVVHLGLRANAQTSAELLFDQTKYNFQKTNGVPLSSTVGTPTGSDGRAPAPGSGSVGTPRQFQGAVTFGAVVAPKSAGLQSGQDLAANAHNLNLPRGTVGNEVRAILLSARVGSPFVSRAISFQFGAIVPPPETDEYGVLLTTANTTVTPNRPVTTPEAYWLAEPYSADNHASDLGFYWSPHKGDVFAVQAGPVNIPWRKAVPGTPTGSPANVTTANVNGITYTIFTKRYLISGSPVQPPRKMFWTEGDFTKTGKPVEVPQARVSFIEIRYNNNFPKISPTSFPQSTTIQPDPTKRLDEFRTLWYDQTLGSIRAYNVEGRIFLEILGSVQANGHREHLGIEIVDVAREPKPEPITTELGERIPAYADAAKADSHLFPDAIQDASQSYAYRHGSEKVDYYATRETRNANDLQMYWLEEGVAGLRWPLLFNRYTLVWPSDVSKYSHYVRPLVNTEAEAKSTAVPLPNENAPFIQYQDALDQVRGKLTEKFEYYSFLNAAHPAHRALLRFTAGGSVRFERVFSWLDANLRSGPFPSDSVASNLSAWDGSNKPFDQLNSQIVARTYAATAYVGERISAPVGETGAGLEEDYLAGHIIEANGNAFNPGAYKNPFVAGFEEANKGAIIPVNVIPNHNQLDVLWFRKSHLSADRIQEGFKNSHWPSVIARYTLEWPPSPSEIVLASNDGSGALPSLQAKGAIYYQNDRSSAGFNPNEEHALMQGGQAYALRDDLNILSGANYTSEPFVLIDYTEADDRPAMHVFKVLREKPSAGLVFDYAVKAGTVLQPPMPLPLLEVPFAPKLPGQPLISLNREHLSWTITASTVASLVWTLEVDSPHFVKPFEALGLQDPAAVPLVGPVWFVPTSVTARGLSGVTSSRRPYGLAAYPGTQTVDPNRWRFSLGQQTGLALNNGVVLASPASGQHWNATISELNTQFGYVEVNFGAATPVPAKDSTLLVLHDGTGSSGQFNSWRLALEPLPIHITDAGRRSFYAGFTTQDRKGNRWVYRGPHEEGGTAGLFMQFYYKTLPGFFFPTLSLGNQPAVGTITPYLRRPANTAGQFEGDPVHGNANGDQLADGNSLGILYRPIWPPNAPVLEMAETLTLPKRGLPAVRGQTSLEILYQQSHISRGDSGRSAILHDPTREKQFDLGDPAAAGRLGAIPPSVATSSYKGLTYFPKLPPHLVDRLFFDPNRGRFGALVFKGQFNDAALGDKFVFLNVISAPDETALIDLCPASDTEKRPLWEAAIRGLNTRMETFVENPNKPATFIPSNPATVTVGYNELAEVANEDVAVDSYALTAVGPGTGYLTLIAGNGLAFTPEGDPVSMHVVRVVSTLYRGEVNPIASSNPLNEKLTMQQVNDLAGRVQDFNFQWLIASPVDGLPPRVYENQARSLMTDGTWSHLLFPLASDTGPGVHTTPADRLANDVHTSIAAVRSVTFSQVTQNADRFSFAVLPPHHLVPGVAMVIRKSNGEEVLGTVHASTAAGSVVVEILPNQSVSLAAAEIVQLAESPQNGLPQSIVFRTIDLPSDKIYTQLWLSMHLNPALGAKLYMDGQLLVLANLGDADTPSSSPPSTLSALERAYQLNSSALAGGVLVGGNLRRHVIAVELYSGAIPDALQDFNVRLEAFESVDVTSVQWIPMDPDRFADGTRAILGGAADVRSLADNYVIMRYQAKQNTHASWVSDPGNNAVNIGWSQWTTPALAEGWIKRVLAGINPFNQRVTDLFNNQVNTDVSILTQAGQRWEGDVALNLDSINNSGLIEIYETVLNRGKMLSIGGGINYGPANDALLLAAGYLNDLYMMVANEAWADSANPTIGIGTKDNTYGEIATALFAFRGQLPSLLEEELALLRGRDDFLLPGVETRPVYNRLIWNFTRGIDAGEVIYSLNYNILDQNTDGKVDAADAQRLFPQGHGDAYGHYLTALKGYYALLLDPNFDWVPRIEAVNILGKPVSVDYQDERKFAAAAAAVARTGKQVFDLTWRRDFQSGSGNGWSHFAATKDNTVTRNLPTTQFWGADHWAARTGQGAYLNWVIGNAILPDADPDPSHAGSIQQVDRTTVPELKELPAVMDSLQTAMDNAEGNLTPLGIPANSIPFDLNPLSVANGVNTTHFEQVYERAKSALKNAVVAFDDAKDVTRLMRSEQDSLADFRTEVEQQELAFKNQLIELYGTPYTDDIGPGKTYPAGYDGPDLVHSMYVDNVELTFGALLDPKEDKVWRIDVQTFKPDWLKSSKIIDLQGPAQIAAETEDRISDFSFITLARGYPVDGIDDPTAAYLANRSFYVEYNLAAHGFFEKPETWTGRRASPGAIQQAVADIAKARNEAYNAFYQADAAKYDLDWAILSLQRKIESHSKIRDIKIGISTAQTVLDAGKYAAELVDKILEVTANQIHINTLTIEKGIPTSLIAGLAAGGDMTSAARAALSKVGYTFKEVTEWKKVGTAAVIGALELANQQLERFSELGIEDEEWKQELRDATDEMRAKVYKCNDEMMGINSALQELDNAQRAYRTAQAEGERIQAEREVFRQRAAAIIQGFRTRDAAFRIFRNEKLERYKTLFDLAGRYTYMAAQAFDYDTGLLHTDQGEEFVNRIVRARALGVMADGEPLFAGSNTGDPGLSSVMAEMNADWSVLKTRLGFKNPDAYGTTASLRAENFRILPGSEGDARWVDRLNAARKANILDDADVRRYCMQIDSKNGLPVPGIVLEFSTTIADGLNLFGRPLAAGDHAFSPASFATKIFGIGVALEGYKGMDDPSANSSAVDAVNASSPADPNLAFLDPEAMSANPYVYLIPVGLDSMRSPPLGDTSVIRTWNVDDVAIPLPFNIGGSEHSTASLWQSSGSLTEPLFAFRKHQPFRPVAHADVFGTLVVYWTGGELERTQYNSTRLLGRSVWNSKWKLIIPGRTLLNDPNEGLDRFIRTVKDVKLYFMSYSYSGN